MKDKTITTEEARDRAAVRRISGEFLRNFAAAYTARIEARRQREATTTKRDLIPRKEP